MSKQFTINLGGSSSGSTGSIATPVAMNLGGTGQSLAPTAGAVVWTDTNSMEVSAAGSSGQLLQSAGTAAPVWVNSPVTYPIAMNLGGTGQSLAATAGAVVYTDSNSMEVSATGSSGQILQSQGTSAPIWLTYEAFSSPLAMNKGGTGQSLAPSAGAVVWTDVNSMEVSAAGSSGQILQSQGTSAPSWINYSTPPTYPLGLTLGGTGAALSASLGAVAYSSTAAVSFLSIGASGTVLQSNGVGAAPTWLTLAAGLVTPLAMNIGGTGQSLAPTNGAIVWTDTNSMEVSAAGTTGQLLQSNGAAAPTWINFSQLAYNVTSVTTTYSVTLTDNLILCNAGTTFAVTMPTAIGNAGRLFSLEKVDSGMANVITINTTSNQMIGQTLTGGSTFTTLNTQGECVELYSDNTQWQIRTRRIPSNWVSYGAIPITTTGTAVTKPTTVLDNMRMRRVGDSAEITYEYYATTNAGAASGTGDYLFGIPTGITIDSTKVNFNNSSTGDGAQDFPPTVGEAHASAPGITAGKGRVGVYNSTTVRLFVDQASTASHKPVGVTSSWYPLADVAAKAYSACFKVPIVGWNG